MKRILFVCTNWQKNLLENLATWVEHEDRNGDDSEAALIYLFFQDGTIFDPPDFPCSLKLTSQQASQLEEQLRYFLYRAEKMGFGIQVREAISQVKPSKQERNIIKIWWNNCLEHFDIGITIFFISLCFFTFWKSILISISIIYLYPSIKSQTTGIYNLLDCKNADRHSIIMRTLNEKEVAKNLKWAEDRLEKIGWLKKPLWAT